MPQFYNFFTLNLFSIYCPVFADKSTFISKNDRSKASLNVAFFLVLMGFLSLISMAQLSRFYNLVFKRQTNFVSFYLRRMLLHGIGSGGGGHGNYSLSIS